MSFLKKYFFFSVKKEEKECIRTQVMENDHNSYCMILGVIGFFQVVILLFNLTKFGFFPVDHYVVEYRILYSIFVFVTALVYLLIKMLYNKKESFWYFFVVGFFIVFVLLWGVSISYVDSRTTCNIVVYSIVTLALAAFTILEPWVLSINIIVDTILINLLLALSPITKNHYDIGIILDSFTIALLSITASIFNFYRRVKSVYLQIKVTELSEYFERKSYIDDLTQLNNRRYLTENIEKPLEVGDNPSGIMLLDIDHFKKINDKYGHINGDICLTTLGKLINNFVKNSATYGVRYGGEEFLIYFSKTNEDEIKTLSEGFRALVEKTDFIFNDNTSHHITVSIGIALANNSINYSGLINIADEALYNAKKLGRNKVCMVEDKNGL